MSKKITLLGSTGSIGTQSLDVIRAQGYEVFGLSAHSHVDKILQQIEEFHPRYVCMTDPDAARRLDAELSGRADAPRLLVGPEGLKQLAALDGTDVVLNSVVGIAGLGASLCAIESGHDLALANKESLVTGGHLVTQAVAKHGVKLLPVDSEHSAIFQCLQDKESAPSLTKILLTASGGPFRTWNREDLEHVTLEQALKHPTWSMGRKITIDSATLFNKGLEMIEARWLFDVPMEKVDVIVHPQSIVHSMVEYRDGTVLAQMSSSDMCFPIQYAVTWPDRVPNSLKQLNFSEIGRLVFEAPRTDVFPALDLARRAGAGNSTLAAVYNAANEAAVNAFIHGQISFPGIWKLVEAVMDDHTPADPRGELAPIHHHSGYPPGPGPAGHRHRPHARPLQPLSSHAPGGRMAGCGQQCGGLGL